MGRPVALALVATLALAGCAETTARSAPPQSTVNTAAWTRLTAGLDAFLAQVEALDEYPPGSAVIVVTGDGRRYVRVHGETKAGSGHAVTADSAFYIASMTKAFVGLLGARLDVERVLPLDTTLGAIWPGLTLPRNGRQADAITLRDLLVHSFPFNAGEIAFLEAYVRDVAPSEYPRLLERYAVARPDGFQYLNLGYNIYAAALEARTGKNWREWLNEKVFSPLGMTATSGRTSVYAADKIAWSHQRSGGVNDSWPQSGGWYLLPPKADGMMQSAGGLMTSANDMARWLGAQLNGRGPDDSSLTPQIFDRARQDRVATPASGDGFSCDGYVYGWRVCTPPSVSRAYRPGGGGGPKGPPYDRMFQHGGGYVGVRSLMTVAPTSGVAIAFLSNSDSMTGYLSEEVTKLALELHQDAPDIATRNEQRLAQYRDENARQLRILQSSRERARAEARWKGWTWAPGVGDLAGFIGSYHREHALLPHATVMVVDGALFLTSSDRRLRLTPAAPDLFGAQTFAYDTIVAVSFVRAPDGRVVALHWNDERYEKR